MKTLSRPCTSRSWPLRTSAWSLRIFEKTLPLMHETRNVGRGGFRAASSDRQVLCGAGARAMEFGELGPRRQEAELLLLKAPKSAGGSPHLRAAFEGAQSRAHMEVDRYQHSKRTESVLKARRAPWRAQCSSVEKPRGHALLRRAGVGSC